MGRIKKAFIYDRQTSEFITGIYEKYRVKMIKLAFSILNDWHEAEDAVEEAFINIARNSGKLIDSEEYQISTYLVNTVRNTSLKILVSKSKHVYSEEEMEKHSSVCESAEEIAMSGFSYHELKDIVEELNPRFKLLLNMKYMGYSNKEISHELDVKADTVRVMLMRIRASLRKTEGGSINEQGHK